MTATRATNRATRLHLSLLPVVALALALAGCGAETPTGNPPPGLSPTGKKEGRPRIALIMKSLANEFFKTMADGARRHQADHSSEYELIVNGIKDERDLKRQVDLIEEMVGQGMDAIVIAPADSRALVAACKHAQEAGIAVINIDNKLDSQVLEEQKVKVPFVGPDNREGARKVGEYLATKLQKGDKVGMLEGIKTAFNGQQRKLGFEEAMKTAGIEIVTSQSASWEIEPANKIASAMLSEHPEIKALLCCNDSMALGALAAVKAAGRGGQVQIVGYDGISAVESAIREGAILATINQHADQLAVFGIEYAIQVREGQAPPADKTTPVDLVTAETLKKP
ncbi:sugar ABC transporter substrate-binding protein [Aquisphaera insulae]|uniref:sugar ABC transporter substrate-binding protein n=1 Tax=Aquisphaera insulae TaxID=2712864 RepID=UPI00196B44BA|nr:sugar ABC transporter substrate-binding protein [Aquisphaera insulae]